MWHGSDARSTEQGTTDRSIMNINKFQTFKHSTENNKYVDGCFDSSNEAMTGTVLLKSEMHGLTMGGNIIHQEILL
jgi:hypothetical protein